jgi:hypothetical protein
MRSRKRRAADLQATGAIWEIETGERPVLMV